MENIWTQNYPRSVPTKIDMRNDDDISAIRSEFKSKDGLLALTPKITLDNLENGFLSPLKIPNRGDKPYYDFYILK